MNDVGGIPQYPWDEGDTVFASALNAAIANTQGTSAVFIGDTPPAASPGTLWWDSTGTGLYIRYNDGTSTQWVVAQNQNAGGEGAVINVLNHGAKGDGTTDDTAAIQGALNAYAGKATVFVPNTGQPYIVGPLSPPTGTDLIIDGTLKLRPSATNALLNIYNVSNIVIRGYGTVDGNKAAQAAGLGGGPIPLASGGGVTNLTVRDITLQNSFYWNMNITQSSIVLIDNVKMVNGTNANEFAVACDECWMTNCMIDGVSNDIAFSFYGGVTNSGAIGNTIKNGVGPGIVVLSDPGSPAPCANLVIADNVIHNCSEGILLDRTSGSSSVHDGIVISGNRIYNVGLGNGSFVGISIGCGSNVTVNGNHVSTVGTASNLPQWGMYAGTVSSGVSFIGNHVYNIGPTGVASWGVGLYIDSTPDVMASGNYFYDNRATPSMASSIGGSSGTRNVYIGNFCGRPLNFTPGADTVTANVVNGVWTAGAAIRVNGNGIQYGANNAIAFNWSGSELQLKVDNVGEGYLLTSITAPIPTNAANDAAAASAGVPVGGVYRNGSVMMVRTV